MELFVAVLTMPHWFLWNLAERGEFSLSQRQLQLLFFFPTLNPPMNAMAQLNHISSAISHFSFPSGIWQCILIFEVMPKRSKNTRQLNDPRLSVAALLRLCGAKEFHSGVYK